MEYINLEEIDFKKNDGLVPAIIQDNANGEVLMLGYMSMESMKLTIEKKETYFYSRSRKELWHKGETSGHYQRVKEIKVDCDNDSILIKVEQIGVACHTGSRTCFYKGVK